MAIELNSASWTGSDAAGSDAVAQVCGEFRDGEKLDAAMSRLEGSDFQRADLSLQIPGEARQEGATREDDTRNLRTLGTSMATAVTAMAAAGIVIASGGAALPAVVAAAAAGGITGAAGTAIGQAVAPDGQDSAHKAADEDGVVLIVHAASADKQAKAEALLRECGATRVWHSPAH